MLPRLIDPPGFNALVRAKHGLMLFNRNDVYIGRSIGKYGEFSEAEIDLFAQFCCAGDIVVEAGSNIGAHTLPLSKLVGPQGRVHAFEPQRIVFQTLCANLAINSITNVESHHAALAAEAGVVHIPDLAYEQENNFGGLELARLNGGAPIPQRRLDDCLALDRCRLVKIDVEGMEHSVITGARALIAGHRPFLYVENDRLEKSKALIELIESLDYRLYWHLPPMFNPGNFAGDSENVFPNLISVNMLGIPVEMPMVMDGFEPVIAGAHPLGNA